MSRIMLNSTNYTKQDYEFIIGACEAAICHSKTGERPVECKRCLSFRACANLESLKVHCEKKLENMEKSIR